MTFYTIYCDSPAYWQTYLQNRFIEETEFIPLIYSIKILRDKERFWKQQIKRYKNQVKGGKNVVSTLKSEYDRKIGNLRKKNISKDKKTKNKQNIKNINQKTLRLQHKSSATPS